MQFHYPPVSISTSAFNSYVHACNYYFKRYPEIKMTHFGRTTTLDRLLCAVLRFGTTSESIFSSKVIPSPADPTHEPVPPIFSYSVRIVEFTSCLQHYHHLSHLYHLQLLSFSASNRPQRTQPYYRSRTLAVIHFLFVNSF